jgi:hypothetical protein
MEEEEEKGGGLADMQAARRRQERIAKKADLLKNVLQEGNYKKMA